MQRKNWEHTRNRMLVCVDSYQKGVPTGRFYNSYMEAERFESLTQFLIKMERCLEEQCRPQSYTVIRTFSPAPEPSAHAQTIPLSRRGARATFEIMIVFRQHTSWQGIVKWREQRLEQSFRSVLELILLLDSALRTGETF